MHWANLLPSLRSLTMMCFSERYGAVRSSFHSVTAVALMSQGLTDSSFRYHLENAKKNGVTAEEMAEILTHAAFYAGWPKAWAAFNMAKEVYGE